LRQFVSTLPEGTQKEFGLRGRIGEWIPVGAPNSQGTFSIQSECTLELLASAIPRLVQVIDTPTTFPTTSASKEFARLRARNEKACAAASASLDFNSGTAEAVTPSGFHEYSGRHTR